MSHSISSNRSSSTGIAISLCFAFLMVVFSFSCQPAAQKKAAEKSVMLDTLINGKHLMVKDTTKYAPEFIRQLKEDAGANESIKVVGDSVWVTSKMFNSRRDTVVTSVNLIPTVLKLNETCRFTSTDPARNFALTLKRTNYTDQEYKLELDGKTIQQGTAMLQSTFYLGKEVSPDEKTGEQLFFDQYIDGSAHWAAIKVEIANGEKVLFQSDDEAVKKLGEIPMLSRN